MVFNSNQTANKCKIIYFLTGSWDPQAMSVMGPRALGMGPIIDDFNH